MPCTCTIEDGKEERMDDIPRAHVDRTKSRAEAEMQFTARERLMIRKLEMIATGTVDHGACPATDLEIVRDLAAEALDEIGWPSVRHMNKQ